MTANATALKEEANRLFAQGKYANAHAKYTEAINVASGKDTAVLYCNRAQTCLLLQRWDDARYDAADALIADPSYHKAWLRLGRAYDGMKDFGASGRAYSIGWQESKNNAPLMRAIDEAVRESRQAFKDTPYALPPCDPPSDPERAALSLRLKEEANALVVGAVKKNPKDINSWWAAYVKYTLALAYDRSSAVLYFNRAHLCMVHEMWGEAIEDAEMAVHIDKDYHKAYLRLGKAYLGDEKLMQSLEVLTKGYVCMRDLKPRPWSPADETLFNDLAHTKTDVENRLRRASGVVTQKTDAPWVLANQYIDRNKGFTVKDWWYTSALPIQTAYKDFSSGVSLLYQTQVQGANEALFGQLGPMLQRMAKNQPPGGSLGIPGMVTFSKTILPITNGLLADMRVFHSTHDDLRQRVESSLDWQLKSSRGFKESEPRALLRAVKVRLRETNGWDAPDMNAVSTRESMTTTVRIWILQATLAWKLDGDYERACSRFQAAADFLELGRREWANVSREFRGAILDLTFLLAVQRAYLECFVERITTRGRIEAPDAPTDLLKTILGVANKILGELSGLSQTEKTPRADHNCTTTITYLLYPEAMAHDAIALCYRTRAEETSSADEKRELLLKSAESLQKSIKLYPVDEELRCEALYHLIDIMFKTGQPLSKSLPLCDTLSKSLDPVWNIWRESALAGTGAFSRWESLVTFAKDARRGIMQKKFKMQDAITPDNIAATTAT